MALTWKGTATEYLWFCCQCGDGPWTPFIAACQCHWRDCITYHRRCKDCRVERHRLRNYEIEPFARSEICASNTRSEDAALKNNGSPEPQLQHPSIPGEASIHEATSSEPQQEEPPTQVTWPKEPHSFNTTTTPAIHFHEFQTSDRPSNLGSVDPACPNPLYQAAATTTLARDSSDPYPTTLPVPDDHNLVSTWSTNLQSFPSEPFLQTQTVDHPRTNFYTPIATPGQSQPSHPSSQSYPPNPAQYPTPTSNLACTHTPNSQPEPERSLLACPFWKKDPHLAWSSSQACCTGHKRIRDVKQHIYRHHVHAPPPSKKRKTKANVEVERITEHQILQLKQYSKRNTGETAQWFAIWDILFPQLKLSRPASPYVRDLEGELNDFRGRVGNGLMPVPLPLPPSPISPVPIPIPTPGPLVQEDSPVASATAPEVWETYGLYTEDDTSFQPYETFESQYDCYYIEAVGGTLDAIAPYLDDTGFWDFYSGAQYIYQPG